MKLKRKLYSNSIVVSQKEFGVAKAANKALKGKIAVNRYKNSTNPKELVDYLKKSDELRRLKLKNPKVDNSSTAVFKRMNRKDPNLETLSLPIEKSNESAIFNIHSEVSKNANKPGIISEMQAKKKSNPRSWKTKNRLEGLSTRKNRV